MTEDTPKDKNFILWTLIPYITSSSGKELLNAKIQEIPGVTATETLISLEQSIKKEIPICDE